MNNDADKLKAEMQSAVGNIYSQLDINTYGLESAIADFESHREAYLAGRQYEADMHRERRLHYAKVEDELLRLKKEYDGLISERQTLCELLGDCAREFCYLLDCEIESTSARHNTTNLLNKIRQYIESELKDYEEDNS